MEELINLWQHRRQTVEETGNFTTGHRNTKFFSHKYTKQEMLDYIDNMIKRIKEDKSKE